MRWWEPWSVRLSLALGAAISVGLLESFWTGFSADGTYRGAPTNTWGGVLAILVILLIVTALLERPWWIPGLAIVEEVTHWTVGYGAWPTLLTVLNHWSHEWVGFPLMPYLTFPIVSIVAHFLISRRRLPRHDSAG